MMLKECWMWESEKVSSNLKSNGWDLTKQLGSLELIYREKHVSYISIAFIQYFLNTISSHYCLSVRCNQFRGIRKSKSVVRNVTFLIIDMNKLTIVPIFQTLIRKHKKQKDVPKVKSINDLLMLISSSNRTHYKTFSKWLFCVFIKML